MSRKSQCSKELKIDIVKRYLNDKESYSFFVKEVGTVDSRIYEWVLRYKKYGENAFNISNT